MYMYVNVYSVFCMQCNIVNASIFNLYTVKAHVRKGHALLAMKDTIRASQAFEKALELEPNSVVSATHAHTHTHTH